jgi:hypothetical protein
MDNHTGGSSRPSGIRSCNHPGGTTTDGSNHLTAAYNWVESRGLVYHDSITLTVPRDVTNVWQDIIDLFPSKRRSGEEWKHESSSADPTTCHNDQQLAGDNLISSNLQHLEDVLNTAYITEAAFQQALFAALKICLDRNDLIDQKCHVCCRAPFGRFHPEA